MEIDLLRVRVPPAVLPEGYVWVAWSGNCLDRHALAKYLSFRSEVDSRVFPCLGETAGCKRLMTEITGQKSFLPGATWLVTHPRGDLAPPIDCGTIQGLAQSKTLGAIQNVGVVPEHRGMGLGKALVIKSLHGFRAAGLRRVYLEVTAENGPAVELYRSVGFAHCRTMYKAVEVETAYSAV
jgi:GNAT superfamily N-acetyltransferase